MRLSLSLILLGLAVFLALASGQCQNYTECSTCTSNKCGYCPGSKTCSGSDGFCSTFKILTVEGCANLQLCGNIQCGVNSVCNRLVNPPLCQCANCTTMDDKGQCTVNKCDSNTMHCDMGQCVCNQGLTPVRDDAGRIACKNLACGNWIYGCGPQSSCKDGDCICNDGYVKAPVLDASIHPGCVLAPKTCADTCKDPNASCVGEICQCKVGYAPSANKTCQLVEVPTDLNCSSWSNCKDCNRRLGCLWCQGEGSGSCVVNTPASSSTAAGAPAPVCAGTSYFTPEQCSCLTGCGENQVCTLSGCACRLGYDYVNGACRDPLNPCAGFVCRENEECKNEYSATSNVTFPICRCVSGYTRVGELCVAPSTSCTDATTCRCVTIEGTTTQVCCQPPFDVDKVTASCRIRCQDGSFVDDITSCPCQEGLVHDLGNELCVRPCADGSAPTFGKCGTQCPDGMSPNPTYLPGSQDPPCGFICRDGSFAPYKEKCLEACANKTEFYCPCGEGLVHDLGTKACVTPCPGSSATTLPVPPTNGKCPEKNYCPEGVPFPREDGSVECKRPCPDGSYVSLTSTCPLAPCPDGFVRDKATLACAQPCSSGVPPYNGNCPVTCTNLVDCCASLGDASRCPPPECEAGKKRNAEGVCVTPCPDGSLPSLKDGACSTNACTQPGFVKGPNDVCGVYCNSTWFVRELSACCPQGQLFSVATQKCLCKDGSIAVEGRCPIVTCEGTTCPCPAPLLRSPESGKCACPDPETYPDPYDGRRCGLSACPPGLVQVENQCVCPITGQLPEKKSVDGRDIIFCRCDPAKYELCPLTPLNCEGSSFAKCLCLTDPTGEDCQSTFALPTKESCLAYPSNPRCFCLLKPTARECLSAPLCTISPNDPSCLTGSECTAEKVLQGKCSRDEFCTNNQDSTLCTCFRPGGCSQAGISFADGVSFNDLKAAECTEADFKNASNPACYCQRAFDPKRCFCNLFPTDAKCLNPDGSAVIPTAEVTRNDACQVVNQVAGAVTDDNPCRRERTVSERPEDISIGLKEGNDLLTDEVELSIKKGGDQPGLLSLSRKATKGDRAPPNATVDDSNISVKVGFVVARCFELLDADGDGLVSDGDSIVSELLFKDIAWTTTQFTNDVGFTTVTLTSNSPDYEVKVTYVISSESTSLGAEATAKPPRNTKVTLEINYPYDSTTTNLACEAKIITDVPVTFVDSVIRFSGRAEFSFETEAASGTTVVPVKTTTVETTATDSQLVVDAGDRVFTVTIVVQGWAVPNLRYDPDLRTSSTAAQASNFEQSTGGGTDSAGAFLTPFFSLAAALVLGVLALLF